MLGAIIGDIVGSIYEWENIRTKKFRLFDNDCYFTDDSVMTLAIGKALMDGGNPSEKAIFWMRKLGHDYPYRGYGGMFEEWLHDESMGAYNSWGNGSAMRISSVGWVAQSVEEVKELSRKVTEVTHNHPEGLKGAEATAMCIYLLRTGASKKEIRKVVERDYYKLDFTLDEIRDSYRFEGSCQKTVPQAIEAFLEATGFEDAIRNAISIGGDSDTLAAITGGIAQAHYRIPDRIRKRALSFLDENLIGILEEFENRYM